MIRLTIPQIRAFGQRLPKPVGLYRAPGIRFEVYRAKQLWSSRWANGAIRALIREARYSYSRYGHRPPLDELDSKAAVYLVKAVYHDSNSGLVEEWLSNRFVPGWGKSQGVCEPEIFFYRGKSIDRWLKSHVCPDKNHYWKNILSYSRMCRILPYLQNHPTKIRDEFLSDRLRHTPILFALTCEQFIRDDLIDKDHPWKVITGIIGDEFVNKGLVVKKNGKLYKPAFTPAHRFLGVLRKEISLNRNVYTYQFPLYWLNVNELVRLLTRLVRVGKLTRESMRRYVGFKGRMQNLETDRDALGQLGNLLSIHSPVVGSALSGQELRALVDKFVSDGPQLRITKIQDMITSTRRMLKAADCVRLT